MRRSASILIGGLFAAAAALVLPVSSGWVSAALSANFDSRWLAVESVGKQDRLAQPRPAPDTRIFSYQDTAAQMTVVTKMRAASKSPVRELPAENRRPLENTSKEKLPVGCEPAFSPVTTPTMAHVSGRCLAAAKNPTRLAALGR